MLVKVEDIADTVTYLFSGYCNTKLYVINHCIERSMHIIQFSYLTSSGSYELFIHECYEGKKWIEDFLTVYSYRVSMLIVEERFEDLKVFLRKSVSFC